MAKGDRRKANQQKNKETKQEKPAQDAGQTAKPKRASFKMEDIGDTPIAMTVYPGSIEGDRVTYSTLGNDRAVFAYGTVDNVIAYTIGNPVDIKEKAIPEQFQGTYQRTVGRKHAEAVDRVKKEMAQGKEGYTIQVNGEKITGGSKIADYFQMQGFVYGPDNKPISKPLDQITAEDRRIEKVGKPVVLLGGVELVVSATITPGYEQQSEGLAGKLYSTK